VGGVLLLECRPIYCEGTRTLAMLELLFFYQLARNPLEAIARRWYCRSLFRASRGRRGCPDSTHS